MINGGKAKMSNDQLTPRRQDAKKHLASWHEINKKIIAAWDCWCVEFRVFLVLEDADRANLLSSNNQYPR
jgi:hypothetical protein